MMMTAEQYVVSKLQEAEKKVQSLQQSNDSLRGVVEALKKDLDAVRTLAHIEHTGEGGNAYLAFNSIWQAYDGDAFTEMLRIMNLTLPEPEPKAETTEEGA